MATAVPLPKAGQVPRKRAAIVSTKGAWPTAITHVDSEASSSARNADAFCA